MAADWLTEAADNAATARPSRPKAPASDWLTNAADTAAGAATRAPAPAPRGIGADAARLVFRLLGLAPNEKPVQEGVVPASGIAADPVTTAAAVLSPVGPAIRAGMAGTNLLKAAAAAGGLGAAQSAGIGAASDISEGRNPLPGVVPNAALGGLIGAGVGAGAAGAGRLLRPRAVPAAAIAAEQPARLEVRPPEGPRLPGELTAIPSRPLLAPKPIAEVLPLEPTITRPAGAATGGTAAQIFRPEKIGLEGMPSEQQHMLRTLESLGMDTRNVRSFGDMSKAAQSLGMRPEDFLKGAASRPISDAEVVATANLINEQSQVAIDATRKLADPALTFDERATAQTAANRAQKLIEDALKRRIRGGTESGRAIAAFRIIGNKTLDPAYWYTAAQKQLGDKPFTPEIKAAIDTAIGAGDRLALARIVGGLHQVGWADKLVTLVKSGLLSNPGTDVRNVSSTAGFSLTLENAASIPAGALDWIVSKATGGPRTKLVPSRVQLLETLRGFRAGASDAGQILRHGDTESRILERYDFNNATHFDNAALETFTQMVFRRLGAEDALFRQPARFRAIAEMAELEAKNAGLKGDAFMTLVRERIQHPTEAMLKLADEEAAYRTFNQASPTASVLQRGIRRNAVTKILGAMVIPFPRIPLNVASAIVDYSPFGVPKQVIKTAFFSKGLAPALRQRYFVEGIGRSMTGTGIFGAGWYLRSKGYAIGGRPKDATEKNYRRAMNIPDYSIRVGNRYVQVSNNAPIANLLMAGVDAYDQFHEDKPIAKKIEGSALRMGQGLEEQTFLKGVSTALKAVEGSDEVGSGLTENLASMLVPSVVGAVARGTDPYQRRIEGPVAAIKAKVPGLRETLPPQREVFGGQRANETGVAAQMLSPVRVQTRTSGRAADVLEALHWSPALPRPEVKVGTKTVKLSGADAERFLSELGAARERVIGRLDASRISAMSQQQQDRLQNQIENDVNTATRQVRERWSAAIRRRNPLPKE